MILIFRFKAMNLPWNIFSILNGVEKWRVNIMSKKMKFDKSIFKKTGEELQEYMMFRRRGSKVEPKKGKGSYSRKEKHRNNEF